MFIAVFTTAKSWKQSKYPSMNEWKKKNVVYNSMEYYSILKTIL